MNEIINYYIDFYTNIGSPSGIPIEDCPNWKAVKQVIHDNKIKEIVLEDNERKLGYLSICMWSMKNY